MANRNAFQSRWRALRFWLLLLSGTLVGGLPTACSTNPATGETQLSLIGREQEIQMGQQADLSIVQTMGLYDDDALQEYIAELGQEMAASTERPDLPWTFRVVDESMVNAFALPGGFVYMTRGILAHFTSEAQLAAVMGHEIGHVTARHSVNQMSRQQLAALGLGIGSILSPEVAQFQGLISAGLQLAFLRFSREDESQSDELGLRYMTAEGYDPTEMPDVFAMLARASGGGEGGVPEWLSTHPNPENREARIEAMIEEMPVNPDTLTVAREEYMELIDGIVFGADPRQGYFLDSEFIHPELRFRFSFPGGWQMVNQTTQVVGQPEGGGAIFGLTLSEETSAEAGLRGFLSQEGMEAGATGQQDINGNPAALANFRVATQQGTIAGMIAFVEHRGQVYQLMGYTSEDQFGRFQGDFESAIGSFEELDDPDLISVEPRRLEIVRLPAAMTLSEFNEEYPSTIPLERLAVINQVEVSERLESGRLVKQVTGEGPPE